MAIFVILMGPGPIVLRLPLAMPALAVCDDVDELAKLGSPLCGRLCNTDPLLPTFKLMVDSVLH